MSEAIDKVFRKIDGLDLIDMDLGFGFSTLELTYSHSDYSKSEVILVFEDIAYLSCMGYPKKKESSIYVGESQLLNIEEFLKKCGDMRVFEHLNKLRAKDDNFNYFRLDGEIYLDVIFQNMKVL